MKLATLRDNSKKREDVRNKTKALFSELLDLDEIYAEKLIDWYIEKTITNKKNREASAIQKEIKQLKGKEDDTTRAKRKELYAKLNKAAQKNQAKNLRKGDIVHVNYGQGYAGELSNSHYGVVLKKKGNNYLIAPLTKTPQPDGENIKSFQGLGLPGENGIVGNGFINFGQIKFVDYRRLENIKVQGRIKKFNVAPELPDLLTKFNDIINQ